MPMSPMAIFPLFVSCQERLKEIHMTRQRAIYTADTSSRTQCRSVASFA